MSTNDRNRSITGVLCANNFSDKGLGADNIKSGHTEKLLRIEDASVLEYLGGNWDGAVDGVGNDENESLWAVLHTAFDEVADDTSIDLEEVVTGHAGFALDSVSY